MFSFLIRKRRVLGWSLRIDAAPEDPSISLPGLLQDPEDVFAFDSVREKLKVS